ncbi:DEAD/DEAH box helicase [Sulfolobus sp. S-194]|uniref:DEAD/DEAH box helicase n=1 Tax=Sulfolobus sp. S-194 TaxID=2512240 RepID=UPI001436F328|nr:DEAD/DEAH box helicase [Sulfolobus sp. S-194]QIW23758.1 DEAD/DEAH box helicase [Sulfolobus sp. S-194]
MSYDLKFAKFVFAELKETHPFFRYPLLTSGDYEPYLHQAEIFYRLLLRQPVRFLIADDVGLGKTIEGVMVIDQLVKNRKARKVLLIVPRVLINQWVYELNRFRSEWNLSVYEYDGKGDVKNEGIYIVSIDTIKRENHKKKFLDTKWDLVVVDEIHKVGVVGSKENLRYKTMAELTGKNPDGNFLGLSATPHRGNDNDYLKRLNLIDPYLREANDDLLRTSVRAIIQKRNKDNVNKIYEKEKIFPDAMFIQYIVEPTEEEKNYYEKIRDLTLTILREYYNKIGKSPKGLPLLSFMIGRRSLSSPYAGLLTFQRMLEKRAAILYEEEVLDQAEEYAEDEEIEEESEPDEVANRLAELSVKYLEKIGHEFLQKFEKYIQDLTRLAKSVMSNDSRVKSVIELAKSHLDKGDKVIIFTEYKDTAEYIYSKFKNELHTHNIEDVIKIVTSETLAKEGIDKVKKWLEKGRAKVMVATDVASEGLNLQSANVIIHYELPLSIVRFEQRNGRVWRLKQSKQVYIYYLALKTDIEQSILDHYYNKLLEITKGTGSEVNVADALVYKQGNAHRIFNLSQEKESIPIYLGYNDPQKKEERITSIKIWESVIQGNVDDIVKTMLNRIKILKDTMRKFALYESMQGAAIVEIDNVRKLVGFNNRAELKSALQTFLEELLKKLKGRIDNGKIFYSGGIIEDYDPLRIGRIIDAIDQIISHTSKDKKNFIVCDSLDYNVYLTNAKVILRNREVALEAIDIPVIVSSKMQEIPLSKFFTEILPLTLDCRKIYPDEVNIIKTNNYSIVNNVKSLVFKLLENYTRYRQLRGRDKWLPNNREEIDVDVNIKGGIIGVYDEKEYLNKTLEALKGKGMITFTQGIYRLEEKGEVKYIKIVNPKEIFNELNKGYWVYTFSNGALVGVKNG